MLASQATAKAKAEDEMLSKRRWGKMKGCFTFGYLWKGLAANRLCFTTMADVLIDDNRPLIEGDCLLITGAFLSVKHFSVGITTYTELP